MNVDAALRRIERATIALGAAGTLSLLVWKGWPFAIGFGVGATVSGFNFRWLKGAADILAAKFTSQPNPEQPRLVALKFVGRYALIGAAGYGIFHIPGFGVSLAAFLGGLFVSVAAIMLEMLHELVTGTKNA